MVDDVLNPEEAHVKRSQLINEHVQEVRAIEKELKKKKLPAKQRETLEQKLAEAHEQHEARLAAFDSKQGTGKARGKDGADGVPPPPAATGTASGVGGAEMNEEFLEERSWGSLSKTDLSEECRKRGLSAKGTKEDLVSRLNIFTLDLRSKAKASGMTTVSTKSADKPMPKFETVIPVAPSQKTDYRTKNKKLWKRRGPPPASTRKEHKSSSSESGSEKGSDDEDSSDQESGDSDAAAPAAKKTDTKKADAGGDKDKDALTAEREAQLRREAVVQGILGQILKKYSKGIKMDDMPSYLEVSLRLPKLHPFTSSLSSAAR